MDESGQMDLAQLRSLQDWNLLYALEGVEGVAEVASVVGFVKQYQVQLDPNRLLKVGPGGTPVFLRDVAQITWGRTSGAASPSSTAAARPWAAS